MSIILQVTIPNEHADRVLAAVNACADKNMRIAVPNHPQHRTFQYEAQQGGETLVQYGQRFLRTFLVEFVRCYEKNEDRKRYDAEREVVEPASQNVPDDIIQ